jgi:hypothetical protein
MNSSGPLLVLIWGKTNRVRPGSRSLVKFLPRVEGKRPLLEVVLERR